MKFLKNLFGLETKNSLPMEENSSDFILEVFPNSVPAPHSMISHDGNITLIMNGKNYLISKTHIHYDKIKDALNTKNFDVLSDLVDVPKAMRNYSGGNVEVNEYGEVSFMGEPVHNTVATRITDFFNQGLPFEPLVNFLENLMANPSRRAVEELYPFLERRSCHY